MNEIHRILDSIFNYCYRNCTFDDSEVIPLLRRGVESIESSDLKKELFERMKKKYIEFWIEQANEDADSYVLDEELQMAEESFLKYWDRS